MCALSCGLTLTVYYDSFPVCVLSPVDWHSLCIMIHFLYVCSLLWTDTHCALRFISCMCALSCGLTLTVHYDSFPVCVLSPVDWHSLCIMIHSLCMCSRLWTDTHCVLWFIPCVCALSFGLTLTLSCVCVLSCGMTLTVYYNELFHLQPGHRVPRYSAIHWALCVPASCNASDVQVALSETLQRHAKGTGFSFEVRVTDDMCQTEDERLHLPNSTIIVG